MKKYVLLLVLLLLTLTACGYSGSVTVTSLPSQAVSLPPAATVETSDITSPTAPAPPMPSVSASASPTLKVVYTGTTIFATSYGEIRGGYSDGEWLNHSEAAALCEGKMTFNVYNLVASYRTVKSFGVTYDEGEYASEAFDGSPCCYLKLPDDYNAESLNGDYSQDPLFFSYLYYGGQFPDIKTVSDTSKASRAVQKLLDEKLGKEKAEANIRISVNADIDGDGEKETVVNADGAAGDSEYCLSCIIESDGTVKIIEDYYFVPADEESESDYRFFYVQNIIDFDGDGISELVVDEAFGEEAGTTVYKYDGRKVDKIMDYWVIDDIS